METEFLSAALWPMPDIPVELDFKQLKISMRGYVLMIDRQPKCDWPDEQE